MYHTYISTLYYIYTSGWAILGVGGADMVIGEAGGTAAWLVVASLVWSSVLVVARKSLEGTGAPSLIRHQALQI
jgi:hypothetical protein